MRHRNFTNVTAMTMCGKCANNAAYMLEFHIPNKNSGMEAKQPLTQALAAA